MDDEMKFYFENITAQLDRIHSRLDILDVKQDRTAQKLEELMISNKLFESETKLFESETIKFELETKKILHRLQDGMDTVEQILKMKELIPQ